MLATFTLCSENSAIFFGGFFKDSPGQIPKLQLNNLGFGEQAKVGLRQSPCLISY
jgi:hypothetical protein